MTHNESETVDSTDSENQRVIEPFGYDRAPHRIVHGRSTAGRTFGMQRRRFATWLTDDLEDDGDGRDVFVIDPEADEIAEIEQAEGLEGLDSINPLALPSESVDESGSQPTTEDGDS